MFYMLSTTSRNPTHTRT